MPHHPHYDFASRVSRLQDKLTAGRTRYDACVITNLHNIRYLIGFAGSAGVLIVTPRDAVLLVDGRYEEAVRAGQMAGTVLPMEVVRVRRYDPELIARLEALGARHVAFEGAHTSVAQLSAWQHVNADITWTPVADWVERQRLVKDAAEIGVLRRAAVLLSDVARAAPGFVAEGKSERSIAADINNALLRAGFEKPAFDTIVAAGPNSALPHAVPTDRQILEGELVLLDFGGVLEGYCVDLTRMACAGRVGSDARSLYMAVREAQDAAIQAVRPGVLAHEVDRAARQVLEQQNLGSAFVHGTGHGLGLDVHEAPRVGQVDPTEAVRLESGMVVTIEPGAYVVGLGGVRLEDDVLVTTEGREVLTTAPRDLQVV